MKKDYYQPKDVGISFPKTLAPSVISHAVKVAGPVTTIYISGQVSTDEQGNVVAPNDLDAQVHQCFKNLEKVLKLAGATIKDVVALNAYMTDIGKISSFRTIRMQYLDGQKPPAITTVGVTGLAGPGLVFELGAIAVLGA